MRKIGYLTGDVTLDKALARHMILWIARPDTQAKLDQRFQAVEKWTASKYDLISAVAQRLDEEAPAVVELRQQQLQYQHRDQGQDETKQVNSSLSSPYRCRS